MGLFQRLLAAGRRVSLFRPPTLDLRWGRARRSATAGFPLKTLAEGTRTVASVCPACACGCGLQVTVRDGRIVNIEGDPSHPISEGAVCARALATASLLGRADRPRRPRIRRAGASDWEEATWEAALDRVAERLQAAREAGWEAASARTRSIALVAGGGADNEELYLVVKLARLLGVIDVGEGDDSPGPFMTNGFLDLPRAQWCLIAGDDTAERNPMAMKWVLRAKENGARILVIDPRFSRTAACADHHYRALPGTEAVILGALIAHILNQQPVAADDAVSRLKSHFAGQTFDGAEAITGIPRARLEQIAGILATRRPGVILCRPEARRHALILQALLGNLGVPGGGVAVLGDAPNATGAADLGATGGDFPGGIPCPIRADVDLAAYERRCGTPHRRQLVHLAQAWFGPHATAANDWGFGWLPRRDEATRGTPLWTAMAQGRHAVALVLGANPGLAGPAAPALARLETLIVLDPFESETAVFWRAPGTKSAEVKTEVIHLPLAWAFEKAGSLTNASRWIQWHPQAVEPIESLPSGVTLLDRLFRRVRARYAAGTDAKDAPIRNAAWEYGETPDPERVLREIGGTRLADGQPLGAIAEILAGPEGATAGGCAPYAGVMGDGNRAARREVGGPELADTRPGWAFAWPDNERIRGASGTATNRDPFAAAMPAAEPLPDLAKVFGAPPSTDFPYLLTLFDPAEHSADGASRRDPWLAELMPGSFVEVSPLLAQRLALRSGDPVRVVSADASLETRALVTPRLRAVTLPGREFEIVAIPRCWAGGVGPQVRVEKIVKRSW